MSILLKNATYIHNETLEITVGDILVDGEKTLLTADNHTENQATEILDCSGMIVTKSFAIGHHHAYSALARGMPAPAVTPSNFYEILKNIWWRLDKALDKDTLEASALATAMASAKAGSTFVIDHHSSPFCIDGSLEILANAFHRVGINHLLCYEISDRDGMDKAEKGLAETEAYLQKHQGLVGLHASFTVGDNTLKKAADLMFKYNSGIHIHVAEDIADRQITKRNYNYNFIIDRLDSFGILNSSKTILAHCIHLDNNERKTISESQAWVVQNTESNLNNNVGFFNSKGLTHKIMLGTDGMHSDMLRSAQASYFAGKHFDNVDFAGIYRRFNNVHTYIKENGFSGDDDNNLVVLDYDTPTPVNRDNFLAHFIFGINSSHVKHVISNGKLIVKNRNIISVDEKEILKFTRQQAKRLWQKLI